MADPEYELRQLTTEYFAAGRLGCLAAIVAWAFGHETRKAKQIAPVIGLSAGSVGRVVRGVNLVNAFSPNRRSAQEKLENGALDNQIKTISRKDHITPAEARRIVLGFSQVVHGVVWDEREEFQRRHGLED